MRRVMVVSIIVCLVGMGWPQGSRSAGTRTGTRTPSGMSQGGEPIWLSATPWTPVSVEPAGRMTWSRSLSEGFVDQVTFHDAHGRRVHMVEQGREKVLYIRMNRTQTLAAVGEEREGPQKFPGDVRWRIRFYNPVGREAWAVDLCCGSGALGSEVRFSPDGQVVVVSDTGEGGECAEGYALHLAPSGCYATRVYDAEGRELLKLKQGGVQDFSPRGTYLLLYVHGEGFKLYHPGRHELKSLPPPEPPWLGCDFVSDHGRVLYHGTRAVEGWLWYEPGRGLQRSVEKPEWVTAWQQERRRLRSE